MKSVIITGATGFIGRRLVQYFLDLQYIVYAVVRNDSLDDISNQSLYLVYCDLKNINMDVFPENCDYIFHLAWEGVEIGQHNSFSQKANIIYMINLLELSILKKYKKFIFLGSNAQYKYDLSKNNKYTPQTSVYGGCKKICIELVQLLAENHFEFVIASTSCVFGEGDFSNRIPPVFIDKLLKNVDLDLIAGSTLYDLVYIDDIIQGLYFVAEKGISGKEYYIGSRQIPTFEYVITEMKTALNSSSKLCFGKFSENSVRDYSRFDLESLYIDTGFECQSNFRKSILKTANWLSTINT